MVLGIFKITLRLRDRHVFIRQSVKVSNVFRTLALEHVFWKAKPFLVETRKIEKHHFHSKLLCQKPMLTQIEWRLHNGPITKSGVFPVTTFCFWKILSSFRTSLKE